MKRLTKYTTRLVIATILALILSVFNFGITLPVNIITGIFSALLGVPGIILSVVVSNWVM